ncbi:alpha-L-fucosidase [Draconibacterium sediminis]|uniref:alpha-L-fucosidase n=2 Tax=Draconibacterium sediminis TaxID=1544798 RepID=A0A0D8JEQ8_9BACT|nr:alpha-L-fucosidase [Draconibacterium sediminis]
MKYKKLGLWAILLIFITSCKQVDPPLAVGPVPTDAQLKWHEMEQYAFVHFSMNTFTDIEWGYGDKSPELFNPTDLDCRQWARVCKEAGLKGIIITAKHHDGFCLWPSKYTEYSVKNSPWRDGKGDLLRELSDACKEYGLKFGVYLSPWDRNHPDYGKPEYITYFRNQLRELLTNYGDVFEIWFDGANGGSGYYGGANETRNVDRKTYYDWENTYKIVRELQPNAILFSDAGPGCRWCGNEEGWVGKTNWSTLRRDEVWPGWPHYEQLRYGHEDGTHWVPAEVDVSIRPGWFYHQSEDHKVKTLPHLLDIYYHSVGRGATLLINFPVDPRGLIHETDEEQILKLSNALKADFAVDLAQGEDAEADNERGNSGKYKAANVTDGDKETYWATDDQVSEASLTINLEEPTEFNRFLIQEYIRLGQRVKEFTLEALVNGEWKTLAEETTIGYKRILRLPTTTATKVRVNIKSAKASPLISNVEIYNAPKILTAPVISRNKEGLLKIHSADKEVKVYYTMDGSEPNEKSNSYTEPFILDRKAIVKAITVDPLSDKRSPVSREAFDIVKKQWKVVGVNDENVNKIFDGDPSTVWHQKGAKMPVDLVVDLGDVNSVKGFRYLPDQSRWSDGIIFNYEFYGSENGRSWKLLSEGEFSNIKNSPIWQTKYFEPVKVKYLKLKALNNTNDNHAVGYAEFDIVTND